MILWRWLLVALLSLSLYSFSSFAEDYSEEDAYTEEEADPSQEEVYEESSTEEE